MKKVIGITGAFGSGKSTAAAFFESKGYRKIHLSSTLEKEALHRDLPLTRKILQDLGNEMREKYGPGILLQRALEETKADDYIVIDGLRNLGEIDELRKVSGTLLAVVANKNVRFERLKKLKRREKLTWDLFNKLDLRDLGVNEKKTGLQTAFCIALADYYLDSNSTLDIFEEKLNMFLDNLNNY